MFSAIEQQKLFGNCNGFSGLMSLFMIKMPLNQSNLIFIYFNQINPIQSNYYGLDLQTIR